MASVITGFLPTTISSTSDALLTVPSGKRYKIMTCSVSNRTALANTFALFVSPGGGVPPDDSGCFVPDLQLNGKNAYREPNGEGMMLSAGDSIYGTASSAGVIGYQISYAVLNA